MFCARGAEALEEAVAAARGRAARTGSWRTSRRPRARRRSSTAPSRRSAGSTSSSTTSAARARGRSTRWTRTTSRPSSARTSSRRSTSRAALPRSRERGGGVIALIASIWGREGGGSPSYNVAKAAEISLAKAMARDLAKDGIRVFSVAPGSTLFPGGSWERRSARIPRGSRRSSSASSRGGASARSTRSRTSSRSSSRPARRGSSARASTVDGGQSRSF